MIGPGWYGAVPREPVVLATVEWEDPCPGCGVTVTWTHKNREYGGNPPVPGCDDCEIKGDNDE